VTDLSSVLAGAADFLTLDLLASASDGTGFPSTNNAAAQAQETADAALLLAQSLQSSVPQRATCGGTETDLPTGDSTQGIAWAVPFSGSYIINVTILGPNSGTNNFTWHVVNDTNLSSSAQIRFMNIPAGDYRFVWEASAL
jgi:hypothetical protein